ncbi:MAG: fumarylacetoacetate hydrolase family protein, partial [Butyricicoccus sp.]|nr:fumarylacetoacetate hydrolase family protein [Butyricicoccus sp.]MDY4085745.1 fumarylacetoacetate hydrolase family protein [Butyricicoccus intestinisimiae]
VIVIGKEAHEVTTEQAQDCIFGYTAGNDFSARDLQFKTGQWLLGKACDDFAPAGPFLVPADALDADHLHISCRVNGELRQDSNTSNMIFSCAEIVSYLSQYMTLKPGDMIYSGTPDGVILGMPDDRKKWLTHGDTIEVTIEGIGTLKNTIA